MQEKADDRMFGELTLPEQLQEIAELRILANECDEAGEPNLAIIARWFADSAEAWLMGGKTDT